MLRVARNRAAPRIHPRRHALAASLAAAAGLATLAGPAQAATFNVAAGDVPALAAAIIAANDHADCSNRIVLPAGTWTLPAPWAGAYATPLTGLPMIRLDNTECGGSRELLIQGAGADFTVIRRGAGAPRFRLLSVTPGGFEPPGGLKLINLSLRGGDLFPATPDEFYGNGAAILIDSSTLSLDGVALTGHRATQGGAIDAQFTRVFIKRSRLEDNSAARQGGAVIGSGAFEIEQSSLSNNTAGSIAVTGASSQGGGAMLWQLHGASRIVDSTLANNRTVNHQRNGGALDIAMSGAPLEIVRSELRGNRASGSGGAIASEPFLWLASSTLSGNAAAVRAGAFFGAELLLSNATVATNLAPTGDAAIVATVLTARNSLVAATLGPTGTGTGANCSADTGSASEGWNLDSDGSCHFAAVGDLAGFDPSTVIDLAPRNWGGMTLAHAPLPGGLAVDRVQGGGCHDGTDQRGLPGMQDGDGNGTARCDVGAMELAPALLTMKAVADTTVRTDLDVRRNDNYGLQDTLLAGSGRGGDGRPPGAPDAMRALVRFDLSALAGLKLTAATLEAALHSVDGAPATSLLTLQAHRVAAGVPAWVEGNGYEGLKPLGAPANLSDPDGAFGVAWAGAGSNPDPQAANNTTQPAFDAAPLAGQPVAREPSVYPVASIGSTLRWHVTAAAQQWIDNKASNGGLVLVDPTTDGSFRGARLGSREGELYKLPGSVGGPRLALSWTMGTFQGDLTGGGCVDRRDLDLLMTVVRAQAVASPALRARMDLNGDGRVDVVDARRLVLMFTYPLGTPC